MAFIGGIIALVIVCGYIGFLDKDLTIDYATFGNSSFLATYLLFCLFFAIYAGFQKEEKIIFGLLGAKEIRFLMRLSAVFCLIGLILSTGRASAASSVIGLMLLFILFLGFKGKNKTIRIVGKILAVLCVSGILFSVILLNIPNTFVQKEFSKFATNIRPVVWQISGELIKEKPILGYGMENFETAFASKANLSLFYASHGKELRFDKAHSIIWDTLISGGLLGLLSYLGIFAAVVYFLWKKRNKFWLFSSFLCLFLAYFLQNLTVFDSPITYFCFFIAISFLSFLETEPEKDQGKINILKGSTIILVIIIFIFSWFYFVHKQYIIVRMASSLIYEYKSEEEKIKIMEEFNKISIWGKYQTIELYVNDVLGKFKEQKLNPEFLKFALDQSMKVKKEKPNNYYNLILISNISRHLENFKLSEMVLKEAEAINNQNMYYLESLIDLKIAENQNKEVFEIIEKTIIREPRIQYLYEQALRLARLLKDESSVDKYATILQRRFNVLSP
ncbi:O-antigen ligase family protein [Candidatus Pacearchaeota archaeon]|jgi:O-antigen polymerase|nr:O-antigen ligase family protein [Candidatus Pacearchaeota archaeon]